MLTAAQVADYFLSLVDEDAGDSMTNLRLQKLLFYAQAWHLALTNRPLFEEDFEAWVHGPVIPSFYRKFKEYGWQSIPRPQRRLMPIPEETRDILDEVWRIYGQFSATHLEEITHSEAPWRNARRGCDPGDSCSEIIGKDVMLAYYAEQLAS